MFIGKVVVQEGYPSHCDIQASSSIVNAVEDKGIWVEDMLEGQE